MQGMHERLGMAMALLNQPNLWVLDEPTNVCDMAGLHEVRERLHSLPQAEGDKVITCREPDRLFQTASSIF